MENINNLNEEVKESDDKMVAILDPLTNIIHYITKETKDKMDKNIIKFKGKFQEATKSKGRLYNYKIPQ